MARRIVFFLILFLPTQASPQSLTSTAAQYREAARWWKAVAEFRQDKNEYMVNQWQACVEDKEAWRKLAETKPEPKKETPWWVWPVAGLFFAGGVTLGVAAAK